MWAILHLNLILGIIAFCIIIALYYWKKKLNEFSYFFWIKIWLLCMTAGFYMLYRLIEVLVAGFNIGWKDARGK